MFYIYILYSESKNAYYVGSCENLERRLLKHNSNCVPSTKNKGPWKLVYTETFLSRSLAVLREREIKRQKSKKYLETLIKSRNC